MKLGILSDTHGLLRPQVMSSLEGCDYIFHGGDINQPEIIETLEELAPVFVVRGNNDKEWAEHIPQYIDLELSGLKIYMTHKKKDLPEDLSEYDLVVYGHSHKYAVSWQGKTLFVNPGSCGPRRFDQAITMAMIEVNDGNMSVTEIEIPHSK